MTIFKTYLKIIWRNRLTLIITTISAVLFLVLFNTSGNTLDQYSVSKCNVNVVYDVSDEISSGVVDYLNEYANFVDVKNQSIDDAIFYQDIDVYLVLEPGFSNKVFSKDYKDAISIKYAADNTSATNFKNILENYIAKMRVYILNNMATKDDLFDVLNKDISLSNQTLSTNIVKEEENTQIYQGFILGCYIIAMLVMNYVTHTMGFFYSKKIKKRNLVSPVSSANINRQIRLGNLFLVVFASAVVILVNYILYGSKFDNKVYFYGLNAFLLGLVFMLIANIISVVVKNRMAVTACNVAIPLMGCFLGGIFIDIKYIGTSVLWISRLWPHYWYARAVEYTFNNNISTVSNLEQSIPLVIWIVVLAIISAVVVKKKAQEN